MQAIQASLNPTIHNQGPIRGRLASMDIFRGLIMIVMALDHVRDFFHRDAFAYDPLDLDKTSSILYFTRWITHFCAPNFVFLAGIGAFLYGEKMGLVNLRKFLWTRGLWLVIMEILIISIGWTFDPLYHRIPFQVIYTIGISMMILGLLSYLKPVYIFTISLIILILHNIYDFFPINGHEEKAGFFWDLILYKHPQFYEYLPGHNIFMLYSFLSFAGIMALGYCIGPLFSKNYDKDHRKSNLIFIGIGMLSLFVVLRLINLYGDPIPWSMQKTTWFSFLSFIKINKYPPSLDYVLVTVGIGLLLLAWVNEAKGRVANFLSVFGRVPFFYYILHLFLIHSLSVVFFILHGDKPRVLLDHSAPPAGFNLLTVYLVWILVIALLYPVCYWYDSYKKTHSQWWLKYL